MCNRAAGGCARDRRRWWRKAGRARTWSRLEVGAARISAPFLAQDSRPEQSRRMADPLLPRCVQAMVDAYSRKVGCHGPVDPQSSRADAARVLSPLFSGMGGASGGPGGDFVT